MKKILEKYDKGLIKKASLIKGIFFDVDGVLTNGKITYDDHGLEIKSFNVKDGQIISYLKKEGIVVGVISGRESGAVSKRSSELKLDFCHQGILEKDLVFAKLVKHYRLKMKEVAFIGDDINDLKVFQHCGLAVCPADAMDYIKERVDLVTRSKGGMGVLREFSDLILSVRGVMEKLLNP